MLKVRQVKIDVLNDNEQSKLKALCKKLNIKSEDVLFYRINKQSIDARDKDKVLFVYEFLAKVKNEKKYINGKDIISFAKTEYKYPYKGNGSKPVIVGSGPSGLFCAYILAENGFKPIIIEQGQIIEERMKSVESFWQTGTLNERSNVQFGEGGAGTFSDGKLNTNVKDDVRHEKVFEVFVQNGAPKDILYSYKPHIGTNLLSGIIKSIRKEIESMGGTFLFNSKMTDLIIKNGKIKEIIINDEKHLACDNLVLAIGHSARDTFNLLSQKGILMEGKPFAIGVRVSHDQAMINKSQYGEKYVKYLGNASYKLTYQSKHQRGVYSFCMCPGGYVINASSKKGYLAINGMSNHERNSENANSAIVVTITPNDFGKKPLDGIKYQEFLEKKAFELGGGKIPIQLFADYQKGEVSQKFGLINPLFKGKYTFANLNELFSEEINNDLKDAIHFFDKRIKGFANGDTIIAGIESRTSSPIRIIRDNDFQCNIEGIFPCGEGAGYAGGITSAAIDGIKVAEMVGKNILKQKN